MEAGGVAYLGRHGVGLFALAQLHPLGGLPAGTVARLNHEIGNDAVEQHPVVVTPAHQLHEVVAVLRGFVVQHEADVALRRFEQHLQPGRVGGSLGLCGREAAPHQEQPEESFHGSVVGLRGFRSCRAHG